MIFYFSATGNCKYVAERIAAARGDKTVSVADCCKSGSFSFEKTGKTVGIISPTYAWGLPVIVREFLQKLTLNTKPDYLWFAATYGTTPGQTGKPFFVGELYDTTGCIRASIPHPEMVFWARVPHRVRVGDIMRIGRS